MNNVEKLIATAEAMDGAEESLYSAEVFLLRQVANAASDVLKGRHWEEFRARYPLKELEIALDDAISAYEKWQADAFCD